MRITAMPCPVPTLARRGAAPALARAGQSLPDQARAPGLTPFTCRGPGFAPRPWAQRSRVGAQPRHSVARAPSPPGA